MTTKFEYSTYFQALGTTKLDALCESSEFQDATGDSIRGRITKLAPTFVVEEKPLARFASIVVPSMSGQICTLSCGN